MMLNKDITKAGIVVCTECIYDERIPSIAFDIDGVCNYCHQVSNLIKSYGTGREKGENEFKRIVNEIQKNGAGKKYDCVIGVSGGTDSSYLLHLARTEWNLKPLAVHYDDTWNTSTATMNMKKVLDATDIDLYTHITDNKEACDIYRAFFFAGVAELCGAPDLAYNYLLRKVAAAHGVSYIIEGHSFVAEGITPLGRNYFDGKYVKSIHKKFGKIPMRTYPLMTFMRFLKSSLIDRPKIIRPYWYIKYSKSEAQNLLTEKYDWQNYNGHHLENRMSSFYHSIYNPTKFNVDLRNNTLSARVRTGELSRETAWEIYNTTPVKEEGIVKYFKKRLALSDEEYTEVMAAAPKSWVEYPTYKKRFELLRPLFYLLAKANLVPMSFYLKYCFPVGK